MWMAIFRTTYGTRRLALILFVVLLSALFLLPSQSQGLLQRAGGPFGHIVSIPLQFIATIDQAVSDVWRQYVALQGLQEENEQLRKEMELLRGQNTQLREAAAATERLAALLKFKDQVSPPMVAATVIGRDAGNWYHSLVLNKGERDGITPEMGVITPVGVVGRVVKTTAETAVVLLLTDSNNAIAGLIQRTREEGIVEGTTQGLARLKYIPLLSGVRTGDKIVTSGLVGGFPRGLAIGTITRIDKEEGALFQSAELMPEVDVSRLEEVLVIQTPYGDSSAAEEKNQVP